MHHHVEERFLVDGNLVPSNNLRERFEFCDPHDDCFLLAGARSTHVPAKTSIDDGRIGTIAAATMRENCDDWQGKY